MVLCCLLCCRSLKFLKRLSAETKTRLQSTFGAAALNGVAVAAHDIGVLQTSVQATSDRCDANVMWLAQALEGAGIPLGPPPAMPPPLGGAAPPLALGSAAATAALGGRRVPPLALE